MISNVTIYLTSLCNLNCQYCYIQKDQNFLNNIDELIANNQNQLLTQILDFDEDIKYTLQSITFWGGEPFLHIERIYNILDDFIKNFKYLDTFYFSTNFTLENEIEELQKLINYLEQYNKKFNIKLQLSIDEPEFINDKNRGKGSTQKFLQNYNKLSIIKHSKLINLQTGFKPTLSKEDLYLLRFSDKNDLYFDFFKQLEYDGFWTLVVPTEWNKEDGLLYKYLMEDLKKKHQVLPKINKKSCNSLLNNLTPIGDEKFTLCHRGFLDNQKFYTKEEIKNLQKVLKDKRNFKTEKEMLIKNIQFAAAANQIDQKYLERKNIIPTLDFILGRNCFYNNYLYNNNFIFPIAKEIPLYYNGAMDIILNNK